MSVVSKYRVLQVNWRAIVPATFAGIAVATPFLLHSVPMLGFTVQRGFALVCHQQPARSFFLFGGTVAVCARCLGIYLGAAAGLLVRLSRQVAWRWIIAAVALNSADWFIEFAGLHGNWMLLRSVLGVTLGLAAAMLVGSVAEHEVPSQPKAA